MPDAAGTAAVAAGATAVAAPVWQIAVKFDHSESDLMKRAAYVMLVGQTKPVTGLAAKCQQHPTLTALQCGE